MALTTGSDQFCQVEKAAQGRASEAAATLVHRVALLHSAWGPPRPDRAEPALLPRAWLRLPSSNSGLECGADPGPAGPSSVWTILAPT